MLLGSSKWEGFVEEIDPCSMIRNSGILYKCANAFLMRRDVCTGRSPHVHAAYVWLKSHKEHSKCRQMDEEDDDMDDLTKLSM